MKTNRALAALDRLAGAEARFLENEFLAPMTRGGTVHVRIAGVVCRLAIEPRDFEGWGIFRPTSPASARLVRAANLNERRTFLRLFPSFRLILCGRRGRRWLAMPADRGDRRIRIEGMIPVDLVEDVQAFDTVRARFDGALALFETADPRRDPALSAYLRTSLVEMVPPGQLERPGLSPEERSAYAFAYRPIADRGERIRRGRDEDRLRRALDHAGAKFLDYAERDDVFRVTFEVDGHRHVSAVSKRDLTVEVAGICLSGQDRRFDLQSLVGVLREGRDGMFVPIGAENGGMSEADYWTIHEDEE